MKSRLALLLGLALHASAVAQAPDMAPQQAPDMAPQQAPDMAPQQAPQQAPDMAPQQAPDMAPQQAPDMAPHEAPAPSDEPTPTAIEEEDEADTLAPAHRPTLTVTVDPRDGVMTGDVVTLTIVADALSADDLSVPQEQELAPFEILDARARVEEGGERARHVFTIELLALEPGEHELPPVRIRILTGDGVIGEVATEPLLIRVGSVLGNEPNAEPRPPTAPVAVMEDDDTLYWIGGALGVVLVTILLTLIFARWWRRREKAAAPPPPPRPAHEIALEKLDALRRRRDPMLEAGEGVEFVDGVSDAVREYLGHRYGFDGLESTTDEVLSKLRQHRLVGITMPEVTGLLGDCDLVKFAKAEFTLEQSELLLSGAYHIVRSTTGVLAPPPSAPAPAAPVAPARRPVVASPPGDARWMPQASEPAEAPTDALAPTPGAQAPGARAPGAQEPVADTAAGRPIPATPPRGIPAAGPTAPTGPSAAAPSAEDARWMPPTGVEALEPATIPATNPPPAARPIPDTLERPAFRQAVLESVRAGEQLAADAEATVSNDTLPLGTDLRAELRRVDDQGRELPVPEREIEDEPEGEP